MRAVIQRVSSASVTIQNEIAGHIGEGLLVLLGLHQDDEESQLPVFAQKLLDLRIFSDEEGKMNRSLVDVNGSLLVVSQFTLYGDCSSGRRPSFFDAMHPKQAEPMYNQFVALLKKKLGESRVQTGRFGAQMEVELKNNGPVTLVLDHPHTRGI